MTVASTRPSYRLFAVQVDAVTDLSPSFRRLTLTGPDLHECAETLLDQRVKVVLAELEDELLGADWYAAWRTLPDHRRPAMRTYTLSEVDRAAGRASIDFACRPAHGPASQFAAAAGRGTRFVLVGPDALSVDAATDGVAWHPGDAREVLLAGDETALPAIRNVLTTLAEDTVGHVVLDLPYVADAVDVRAPAGVRIDIVGRGSAGVGAAAEALTAAWSGWRPSPVGPAHAPSSDRSDAQELGSDAGDVPNGPGDVSDDEILWEESAGTGRGQYLWCAGEASWIARLRGQHRVAGLPRRAGSFMGYWRAGVRSPG